MSITDQDREKARKLFASREMQEPAKRIEAIAAALAEARAYGRLEQSDIEDNKIMELHAHIADQQARHEVELRALQSQIAELERDRDRLRGLLRAPGLYPPTYETDRKPTL